MKDEQLYRLTFSKSLADLICQYKLEFQVERLSFKVGKKLEKDEKSKSGLYGIMDKRKGLTLRVAMSQELSDILCDYNWRYPVEVWLL